MVQLPVNDQTQALDVEFDSTRREQLFLFPYESQFKKWEEIISKLYVSLKDKITRHIEREQNWIRSYQQNYAKHMLPGHIQFTLKILDTKRVTLHLYLNLEWPNFSGLWAVHSVFTVQKRSSSSDYGIHFKSIICAKLSV